MEINGILLQNQAHEISDHIGKTLLPFYAKIIAKVNKNTKISKFTRQYEVNDSVCFICDCLELGSQSLFDQYYQEAGPKFLELIHYAL